MRDRHWGSERCSFIQDGQNGLLLNDPQNSHLTPHSPLSAENPFCCTWPCYPAFPWWGSPCSVVSPGLTPNLQRGSTMLLKFSCLEDIPASCTMQLSCGPMGKAAGSPLTQCISSFLLGRGQCRGNRLGLLLLAWPETDGRVTGIMLERQVDMLYGNKMLE